MRNGYLGAGLCIFRCWILRLVEFFRNKAKVWALQDGVLNWGLLQKADRKTKNRKMRLTGGLRVCWGIFNSVKQVTVPAEQRGVAWVELSNLSEVSPKLATSFEKVIKWLHYAVWNVLNIFSSSHLVLHLIFNLSVWMFGTAFKRVFWASMALHIMDFENL